MLTCAGDASMTCVRVHLIMLSIFCSLLLRCIGVCGDVMFSQFSLCSVWPPSRLIKPCFLFVALEPQVWQWDALSIPAYF